MDPIAFSLVKVIPYACFLYFISREGAKKRLKKIRGLLEKCLGP